MHLKQYQPEVALSFFNCKIKPDGLRYRNVIHCVIIRHHDPKAPLCPSIQGLPTTHPQDGSGELPQNTHQHGGSSRQALKLRFPSAVLFPLLCPGKQQLPSYAILSSSK